MPYDYITRSEAETQLALRLDDPNKVRWVPDELLALIYEALYTWQTLTGMWEVTPDPVSVAAGTAFVELPTTFPDAIGYTLRDRTLVGWISYKLFEEKSTSSWIGTDQFSLEKITAALQRRRNQFILETGCRLTRTSRWPADPAVIGSEPSIELADEVMDVYRVSWRDLSDKISFLQPSDEWRQTATDLRAGLPRTYAVTSRAGHELTVAPEPIVSGYLSDLFTFDSGADLDPAAGVLIGIPDNFAWIIVYGALADLLSADGPAQDYARGLFCERRYRMGVAVASVYQSVRDVRINGKAISQSTLESFDSGTIPNWPIRTGSVRSVAPFGMDWLALCLPPSSAVSMLVDLIRTAPIPSDDDAYLQIGREYLDIILGYAQHLGMFKVGGSEFAATSYLAGTFFDQAALYNPRLKKAAFEDLWRTEPIREPAKEGTQRQTGGTLR